MKAKEKRRYKVYLSLTNGYARGAFPTLERAEDEIYRLVKVGLVSDYRVLAFAGPGLSRANLCGYREYNRRGLPFSLWVPWRDRRRPRVRGLQ